MSILPGGVRRVRPAERAPTPRVVYPVWKFLKCHPESFDSTQDKFREGSQVLIEGSDGDITGGWFEAEPARCVIRLRFRARRGGLGMTRT